MLAFGAAGPHVNVIYDARGVARPGRAVEVEGGRIYVTSLSWSDQVRCPTMSLPVYPAGLHR